MDTIDENEIFLILGIKFYSKFRKGFIINQVNWSFILTLNYIEYFFKKNNIFIINNINNLYYIFRYYNILFFLKSTFYIYRYILLKKSFPQIFPKDFSIIPLFLIFIISEEFYLLS